MNDSAKWMMQAIPLYGELSERLSITVTTIERFISPDGDCNYFADMTDFRAVSALQHIKKHLERLQDLKKSLNLLETTCQQVAKAVSFLPLICTVC